MALMGNPNGMDSNSFTSPSDRAPQSCVSMAFESLPCAPRTGAGGLLASKTTATVRHRGERATAGEDGEASGTTGSPPWVAANEDAALVG
jgi:hypothetical protein